MEEHFAFYGYIFDMMKCSSRLLSAAESANLGRIPIKYSMQSPSVKRQELTHLRAASTAKTGRAKLAQH